MGQVYVIVDMMGERFSLETAPADWPTVQGFLCRPFGPAWRETTEREALAWPMMDGRQWVNDIKREV